MRTRRSRSLTPSGARQPADLRANASAATAAVLFGASVIAVRVAVREVPPVSLAVLRFGQGGRLLAGILLVVAPRYPRTSWERLRLLGAVYGLIAKRVLAVDNPATVTTYAMLIGAALLLPAALVDGLVPAIGRLDWRLLGLVVFLGVLGGAVAFQLWTWALSRLTPTQVAVYVNLTRSSPPSSASCSWASGVRACSCSASRPWWPGRRA